MKTFQTVHCATAIILIISLLTEKCHSRNAENVVELPFENNVKFVKKSQHPDLTVQPNHNINNYNKPWYIDNPLDILEDKDESTQPAPLSSEYLKTEGHDNRRKIFKNRVLRQINNGYSSIYPSLPTFNPNAQNTYPTPYKPPGPQYNGFSLPPTYPYNPSNVNSFNSFANYNRFSQNSTFQGSIPSNNYSRRPSYYPFSQNLTPNNFTKPNYIQNNSYNQSSPQNFNHYYPNNNFNSGFPQPNYNQGYGLGKTNNTNIYNPPNGYNFSNLSRTSPVYNSAQPINGSIYSQPFRSPNYSNPSYPSYGPNAVNTNFRSNNSWVPNYSQNAAFNPYYKPMTQTSNQTYSVNPAYMYNTSYPNYRNQQPYNQNNYYNNPQNNSFTANKNQFYNPNGETTVYRPVTTPISTPYYRPNTSPQNNFGGPNQSYLTEPNHFFYTPPRNNINGSVNYNLPHKYYK